MKQPVYLITFFEPFAQRIRNASQFFASNAFSHVDVFHEIAGAKALVETRCLPVAFSKTGDLLEQMLDRIRPQALVLFGEAAGKELRVESQALNEDFSKAADNEGEVRDTPRPIIEGAPRALSSTIDVRSLADAWAAEKFSARVSADAGGFLCNHAYYRAQEWARRARPQMRSVFVHVPVEIETVLPALVGGDRHARQRSFWRSLWQHVVRLDE